MIKFNKKSIFGLTIIVIFSALTFISGMKIHSFINRNRAVISDNENDEERIMKELSFEDYLSDSDVRRKINENNRDKHRRDFINSITNKNQKPNEPPHENKTLFFTFDDGPSKEVTPQILDILNSNKIKATFFVIGKSAASNPELVQREINEGFIVENHTYSHDPGYEYAAPQNLLDDFKKNEDLLKTILPGYNNKIVRFPGGSRQRKREFVDLIKHNGYEIVDWNCLSSDAENEKYTPDDLFENVKKTSKNKKNLIVLMHDSSARQNTVQVLPRVIDYFRTQGYTFKTLNDDPSWKTIN
jgi:Predicted xylanase/chitin deacetylase